MEHVLAISTDGVVRSMHSDKFALDFLGKQVITRASDIRWDERQQRWDIWFNIDGSYVPPHETYQGFAGYDIARDHEVAVMNECMKEGTNPMDPAILAWSASKRA